MIVEDIFVAFHLFQAGLPLAVRARMNLSCAQGFRVIFVAASPLAVQLNCPCAAF